MQIVSRGKSDVRVGTRCADVGTFACRDAGTGRNTDRGTVTHGVHATGQHHRMRSRHAYPTAGIQRFDQAALGRGDTVDFANIRNQRIHTSTATDVDGDGILSDDEPFDQHLLGQIDRQRFGVDAGIRCAARIA